MKKLTGPLLGLVIGVGIVGLAWAMWPPKVIRTPPEIVTRVETVPEIDTAGIAEWRDQAAAFSDTINLLRELLIAKPVRIDTPRVVRSVADPTRVDTVYTFSRVLGMWALNVPLEWGDSTLIHGFSLWGDTLGVMREEWRTNYFTVGPLKRIVLSDSLPPLVEFHPMPDPPCTFGCKAKIAGIGGLTGAAVALLLVLTLGG